MSTLLHDYYLPDKNMPMLCKIKNFMGNYRGNFGLTERGAPVPRPASRCWAAAVRVLALRRGSHVGYRFSIFWRSSRVGWKPRDS